MLKIVETGDFFLKNALNWLQRSCFRWKELRNGPAADENGEHCKVGSGLGSLVVASYSNLNKVLQRLSIEDEG